MGLCMTALVVCVLLKVAKAQSIAPDEVCSALDCSLSTYILIGIAGLYSVISLICLFLIITACCCCRNKRRAKIRPEDCIDGDDDVFGLPTIAETEVTNLSTAQPSKVDIESSTSSESSSSDNDERDTTPVIKNKSRKHALIQGARLTPRGSANSSPLVKHRPRSSPVPPDKVPVPFADETEKKIDLSTLDINEHTGHGPVRLPPIDREKLTPRQRRKAQTNALKGDSPASTSSRGNKNSPFLKRRGNGEEHLAQEQSKGTPRVKSFTKITSSSKLQDSPKLKGVPIKEGALKFEMVKISHKWRVIGTAFTLPASVLDNISIICNENNDTCMFRVCQEWFNIRKQRNWSELIDILKLESVNEWKMAAYIRRTYLEPSENDDLISNHSEGNLSYYFNQASQMGMPELKDEKKEPEGASVSWID